MRTKFKYKIGQTVFIRKGNNSTEFNPNKTGKIIKRWKGLWKHFDDQQNYYIIQFIRNSGDLQEMRISTFYVESWLIGDENKKSKWKNSFKNF